MLTGKARTVVCGSGWRMELRVRREIISAEDIMQVTVSITGPRIPYPYSGFDTGHLRFVFIVLG